MARAGVLAACVLALAGPARALDPDRAPSQYLHDAWSSRNGFPGGAVHGIAQSADGYLWIACERGLVRFDGTTFRLVQPPGLPPERAPSVLALAADAEGSIWAQLQNALLIRARNGRFEPLPSEFPPTGPLVTALTRTSNGIVIAVLDRGVVEWRAGEIRQLVPQSLFRRGFVMAMAQAEGGDLLLGTRDSGVLRVNAGRVTPVPGVLPDQKVNAIMTGSGREFWVGTDAGVARWDGTGLSNDGVPGPLARAGALAMVRDRDGNAWFGLAASGLVRVNWQGMATVATDPAAAGRVNALFEDREGSLWIGTPDGLERLRDGTFTTYSRAEGAPSGSVGPVHPTSAGLWMGGADGGLHLLRDGRATLVPIEGLRDDVVYSIDGPAEDLWIGRRQGGLTSVRPGSGGAIRSRTFTRADGLPQDNVYAVRRAADGSVWAGTLSAGVAHLSDGRFTTFTTAEGLPSNTVTAIEQLADGTIWLGTPNGACARAGASWRRYTIEDGLPSNDVATLFEDPSARLWIGTSRGLALVVKGRLSALAVPDALHAPILGFTIDRRGDAWLATPDAVIRADADALAAGRLTSADLRIFGTSDGLHAGGVKRQRSLATDASGRVWVSSAAGLVMADAARTAGEVSALAVVEGLDADGSPLSIHSSVVVPPLPRRITLSFAGLALSMSDRVRLRYRLDGVDRDWSAPTEVRQVAYSNLAPGEYTFRVAATTREGSWNGPEANLRLGIEPAYWQTTWFHAVLLAGAAGFAWVLYRVRLRQVGDRLTLGFEARLAERSRIARELHDTLLQGFISASMQLHVAAMRLPAESPSRPAIDRVLAMMSRVIDEGRHAVQGLRAPRGSAESLEEALTHVPDALGDAPRAELRVVVEGRTRVLNPIVRDDAYLILREALLNAFRHAQARHVVLEIEYGDDGLRAVVRDDGVGIRPPVVSLGRDGHFGLAGMKERAAAIGGRLSIWSREMAGTEVELAIPASVSFVAAGDRGPAGWRAAAHEPHSMEEPS